MNSDSKMLLEEIRKEFADLKKLIDKRFADHDAKWELRLTKEVGKREEHVEALETMAKVFETGKPTNDSSVETVKTGVCKLAKHWERSVKDKSVVDPGLFPLPGSASFRQVSIHYWGQCLRAHL